MEHSLLLQFLPTFMVAKHDCSSLPAEFKVDDVAPEIVAENGTVYGQVFPGKFTGRHGSAVELRYYLLWRNDCGRHGHPLDTEHVAVLVEPSHPDRDSAGWRAIYWYAAAHEDTVCDVSQIARAPALDAENGGATVWISRGKHASYLSRSLCYLGCGADRCAAMTELVPAKVINLGEPGFPMNGSAFIVSKAWPLGYKMSTSNFPAAVIARFTEAPDMNIVLFNPGPHPIQGVIARSSSTEQALATSEVDTTEAVSIAAGSTRNALANATDSTDTAISDVDGSTDNALQKSYRHTRHALRTSVWHIGEVLKFGPMRNQDQPH